MEDMYDREHKLGGRKMTTRDILELNKAYMCSCEYGVFFIWQKFIRQLTKFLAWRRKLHPTKIFVRRNFYPICWYKSIKKSDTTYKDARQIVCPMSFCPIRYLSWFLFEVFFLRAQCMYFVMYSKCHVRICYWKFFFALSLYLWNEWRPDEVTLKFFLYTQRGWSNRNLTAKIKFNIQIYIRNTL